MKTKIFICTNCSCEFKFKGYSTTHKFCSIACSKEFRKKQQQELWTIRYNEWLDGKPLTVKNPRALIRSFIIERDGYKCYKCGIDSWNGKEITLWADHIDGNATNNTPTNFRLVCPNCDSQSVTFGAKNYGNGRKSRGLPQYG